MKASFSGNGPTTTTLGDTSGRTLWTCIATGISVELDLLRKLRKEQDSLGESTSALVPLGEREKENLSNGSTKKPMHKCSSSNNNNKENDHPSGIGNETTTLLRLPFVDWKDTLTKAFASKEGHNDSSPAALVSTLVRVWLLVLLDLEGIPNNDELAVSARCQIYRRLSLLTEGFLAGNRSHATATTRFVVGTTRTLARTILRTAGSIMKKRDNAVGVYYYCWFTAVAAECCEFLGYRELALLAYKSVRSMEDKGRHGRLGVYLAVAATPANTPTTARKTVRPPAAAVSSKIGNDLVPAGSLTERISRCASSVSD